MTYVWKKIRVLRNSSQHIQWNKWQIKDRSVAIEEAIDKVTMGPPWVLGNKIEKIANIKDNEFNAELTQDEIVRAIKSVRKNSSPGMDNIEYNMFKWIPKDYTYLITKLFNKFWETALLKS